MILLRHSLRMKTNNSQVPQPLPGLMTATSHIYGKSPIYDTLQNVESDGTTPLTARDLVFESTPPESETQEMELIRIRGDGRCLFRSLVVRIDAQLHHAARNDDGSLQDKILDLSERIQADGLRCLVTASMLNDNFEEYKRLSLDTVNADMPSHLQYSSIEDRIASMAEPLSMAGELEIITASKVLKRPIRVYRDGSMIASYGEEFQNPLYAQFSKVRTDVGHYD
ncbi:hypothetical protein SNE40_011331 [Patella caerulea]|uniref:OTU domain-containing protein n=1 Tax=Patella caerulea TaxID=87958 RepID=A0AAN8JMG2_PATCE